MEDALVGAAFALVVATLTAPVGVSGAVFLVPVQLSVLGTANPAVTPTNLLYNLVAIPGALLRYGRQGALASRLTRVLVMGTLPGVIVGAVLRVEVLSSSESFFLIVAAVLGPLGAWLALFSVPEPRGNPTGADERFITAISLAVGVIGGIYGIGGGSLLAPVLVGMGFAVAEVAPAALLTTFITSIAGIATFGILGLQGNGDIAPDWSTGLALGAGGLVGAYLGAALQPRLSESLLRRGLGVLAMALAVRYFLLVIT
jgi:uncharacterized membrane protein YfcA